MTVETTSNRVNYEGNGATTVFSYSFLIPATDDVIVTYIDADGNQTVLNTAQYSITGIADANGGTVTYPLSGSPIAAGTFISIVRELALVQETDFVNQDGFYPQVLEDALDYLTMLVQQVNTPNLQSIRVPDIEDAPDVLPAAAQRANQTLIFDSDGQPGVGSPSSAPVSTAMQPVVAAATLAAGRSAFGVGFVPVAVTTNQTVLLADISTRYMATGTLTFTMPDSTQVPAGFSFSVYALTADCVADPVGTDTIYGYGLGVNATIAAGTVVELVTDGAGNWWPATIISTEDFVGAIRPYGGFVEPSAKYVFCHGQSLLRSSYPAAFAALSMAVTVTKTSGSPVIGGFTALQVAKLGAGMVIEGTGIPAGTTILTNPGSGDTSITLSANATNSLSQTATIIPYNAVDTTHFTIPDLRGRTPAGAELTTDAQNRLSTSFFGSKPKIGNPGGGESQTISQANLPGMNFTVTDNRTWATGNIPVFPTGTGGGATAFLATIATGVNTTYPVTPSGAAPTAASGGSGTGHANVQPTLVINYLIRVLP